jgi:hypothetical protein
LAEEEGGGGAVEVEGASAGEEVLSLSSREEWKSSLARSSAEESGTLGV